VFFVRRVALVPAEPAGPQIALALEAMAPFPPEQLYAGYLAASDGAAALIFAAFRRRFTPEDTEAWEGAHFVTAEFAPLLAARPGQGDDAVLYVNEGRAQVLVWRRGEELPGVVLCRETGEAGAEGVLAAALARAGLAAEAVTLKRLDGALALSAAAPGGALQGRVRATQELVWPTGWSATGDVRDPDFLAARRQAQLRDLWLWRGLLGAAALLLFVALLDLGSGILGAVAKRRHALVKAQTEDVRHIETSEALAKRIAELSEKRLMPFEMMALINPARPETIVFQRAITRGLLKLEIEAQASNAEAVGKYANELKTLPGVATAAARGIQARGGVTSFILDVEFKADAFSKGGES